MKPIVFLTGCAGRIGTRVLRKLLPRGFPVRALIHKHKPDILAGDTLDLVQGDILDQQQIKSAMRGAQIVCHLAATFDMFPPSVFEKNNDALFDTIVRGTYNVLEAARTVPNLNLMLFASTDAVYATGPRAFFGPITEETEPSPMPGRFYAVAKLVGESLCTSYGKSYGLPWSIIRINWALGEDELLRVFDYSFWQESIGAEERRRLDPTLGDGKGLLCPIFPDGSPAVDQITDPEDTAEGFVLAMENHEKARDNVFNIAASSPFTYKDFIEKISNALGMPYDSASVRGFEPYAISCEKANRVLGYRPNYTMEMMIDKAIQRKLRGIQHGRT